MSSHAERLPLPVSSDAERALMVRWLSVARLFFLRHAPGPDGNDLAHEAVTVLLEAVRSGQLRDSERTGGFLLGVCRNLVSRRARSQSRRENAYRLLAEPEAEEPVLRVDTRRLWECFNLLPARSRTVIARSFVDDEDAATIASRLKMTEGNVRVVRHRALTALRTCLERSPQ